MTDHTIIWLHLIFSENFIYSLKVEMLFQLIFMHGNTFPLCVLLLLEALAWALMIEKYAHKWTVSCEGKTVFQLVWWYLSPHLISSMLDSLMYYFIAVK